jgi:hypothetical protein
VEIGGSSGPTWARQMQPPLPKFAWTQAPATGVEGGRGATAKRWKAASTRRTRRSCTVCSFRIQARRAQPHGVRARQGAVAGRHLTDWAISTRRRPLGEAEITRTYHFVMPFHRSASGAHQGFPAIAGHIWVPMDDGNTMVTWHHSTTEQLDEKTG